MIKAKDLDVYLADFLGVANFKDYCPNGRQIAGKDSISNIISGVSINQALIEAAVAKQADAILVHHGLFWHGDSPCIVGIKHKRIKTLLENEINLFAYHLPLDGHTELGNNAMLAKLLDIKIQGGLDPIEKYPIGNIGVLKNPCTPAELSNKISSLLNREPLHIAGKGDLITKVAWCTGAAQKFIGQAIKMGADAYITGEVSEPTTHAAIESGVHFYAAGHHATERYGAKSLGEHLAKKFKLQHEFIDIDNPV